MMTMYLKMPPFSFIQMIVQGQLYAVVGLSIFVLVLVIYRNRRKAFIDDLRQLYADALLSEILEFLGGGAGSVPIQPPAWFELSKKKVLKEVFFDHFKVVNGPEKAFLARRYEQLGFTQVDAKYAFSFFWWNRLTAVSNLALTEENRFAPLFRKLTVDRSELVVASAYLALSALRHPLNRPISIEKLPPEIVARKNVMYQVLHNWVQIYGHSFLSSQIFRVKDPDTLSVLIAALSSISTPEIAAAYARILDESPPIFPHIVEQMLALIRKVGDPSSEGIVRRYLEHPDESVRLHVVQYLIEIGQMDAAEVPTRLLEDSMVLRSWLKDFSQKRVAA